MLKRILLACLVLLLALAAYIQYGKLPTPPPNGSLSSRWLASGPSEVSYFDVTLVDDTRITPANGEFSGAGQRRLKTRIWHPTAIHSPRPLVIYSHGFMSMRSGGSYLAEHLASHGYIVAAMDYPLSRFGAPGGPVVKDVAQQAGDVSFLLDQFLSWGSSRGHQFYKAVDEARIAVMGFSLGALTSQLVAFHPQFSDSRIDAVVSIAGPGLAVLPQASSPPPMLVIASPEDAMIDYQSHIQPIPSHYPGAILVTLDNASHTGFTALSRYLRWLDNPDWLGCNQLRDALAESVNGQWGRDLGAVAPQSGQLTPGLCDQQTLPAVMNPVRQQWLTTMAVHAFLESQFALSVGHQQDARQFLMGSLPSENANVRVTKD